MKFIMHNMARLFLLLSLAMAPLYGVTAPLLMHDMGATQSQNQDHPSVHDVQKGDHGCCDVAGGCNDATDCQAGCSSCGHCNVAGGMADIPFDTQLSGQTLLVLSETRLGIVLPLEIRPPQVF